MSKGEAVSAVDMRSTAWRLTRTLVIVSLTVVLGAVSHALAGGSIRPSGLMLACLVPMTTGCFAVTKRRLKLPALVAMLGAGQFLIHELLMAGTLTTSTPWAPTGALAAHHGLAHHLGPGGGTTTGHEMMSHAATHHGEMVQTAMASQPATQAMPVAHAGHMASMSGGQDPGFAVAMLVAHVLGTLAVAACLASLDLTLWVLTQRVLPWIRRVLTVLPDFARPFRTLAPWWHRIPQAAILCARAPVRGPPSSRRRTPLALSQR